MHRASFKPTKLTLITLLFSSMLILMGGAAVAPALPAIGEAFTGQDPVMINLIITLPSLAIAMTGIGLGMLADRWGKVKVMLTSLTIFALAGLSGFFLEDLYAILIGRFLVGVGIAGITCTTTALISEYYGGVSRVRVLSYQTAAMGVGVLILETSGGALAGIGWHYPFLIYGLGFVFAMVALVSMEEPSHPSVLPDIASTGVRKTDGTVIAFCYSAIFLAMLIMFVMPSKLPDYMLQSLGASSLVSGLFLGGLGICTCVTALLYRRISSVMERRLMVATGFFLIFVSYGLFIIPPSYVTAFMSVCLLGAGMSFITPPVVDMLVEQVVHTNSGKIMGGYSTLLSLGQFLCTFLIAFVMAAVQGLELTFAAFGMMSGVISLAYFATFVASKGQRIPRGEPAPEP
jgi:MFS family permease